MGRKTNYNRSKLFQEDYGGCLRPSLRLEMQADAAEPNEKIVRNEEENTQDSQRAGQKRKISHNKERQKSANIQIDRALIPTVPLQETFVGERLTNLADLGVSAYRPEEMEKNVMEQVGFDYSSQMI